MHVQWLLAVVCIAVPAGVLVSGGCGIIGLPVEAPKVIGTNAQTLKFTVDVVDPAGKPLDGVSVVATWYSRTIDPVFMQVGEEKSDPPRIVDKTLTIDHFGKFAVGIEYSKPGFKSCKVLYSNSDETVVTPSGFYISRRPLQFNDFINVKKDPKTKVILSPGKGAEPFTRYGESGPSEH